MNAIFRRTFANPDVAIDLGTAVTRVSREAGSKFMTQPTNAGNRPAMKSGVVVDCAAAVEVLRPLIARSRRWYTGPLRALTSAPTNASMEERASLKECLLKAGAAAVVIVPQPLAAAIVAGADISSRYAQLVVDFGEGVTDCALIREG